MSALQEHDQIQLSLLKDLQYFFSCSHNDGIVHMEFPVPGKNDPVGYLDLLIETGGRGIAIEVKSHIESVGETVRQINKYKAAAPWCDCPYQYGHKKHLSGNRPRHYQPEFYIASPDFRYIDVFESQGIRFLKVGPEANNRSNEIRLRLKELISQGIQESPEVDEIEYELRRYYGVMALNLDGIRL